MAEGGVEFSLTYDLDAMQVEERPSNEVRAVDESEAGAHHDCGRKCVRKPDSWEKKHVKKKGLRQNAPQVSIESMAEQSCCRRACMQHRQHFSTLVYDEQNLYLTGLMIRKETKKSVGHKRK